MKYAIEMSSGATICEAYHISYVYKDWFRHSKADFGGIYRQSMVIAQAFYFSKIRKTG
jgi:hypothetical protein